MSKVTEAAKISLQMATAVAFSTQSLIARLLQLSLVASMNGGFLPESYNDEVLKIIDEAAELESKIKSSMDKFEFAVRGVDIDPNLKLMVENFDKMVSNLREGIKAITPKEVK